MKKTFFTASGFCADIPEAESVFMSAAQVPVAASVLSYVLKILPGKQNKLAHFRHRRSFYSTWLRKVHGRKNRWYCKRNTQCNPCAIYFPC